MRKSQPHTLLCTIGTSLLYPNLVGLTKEPQTNPTLIALAKAYSEKNWLAVAIELGKIDPTARLCGAEINSVTDLLNQELIEKGFLHLFYSETDDGEAIAQILRHYFSRADWEVETHRVEGLRDDDPNSFRTKGLRNLAKLFGEQVRLSRQNYRPCAINATGGYKAQIAIAVLMGQALDIPVYYKHERFDAIIPFPPMPVALDFSLWLRANEMFTVLSKTIKPQDDFEATWDERFEPLVNREKLDDGKDYLELSATGQIFHETFHSRFQELKETRLPRCADSSEKQDPDLRKHNYGNARGEIQRFLEKLTHEKCYICRCFSTYWNPRMPESTRFRLAIGNEPDNIEGKYVEGIYSNGTWCVKFKVTTTATDEDQLSAIVADLNDWLDEPVR